MRLEKVKILPEWFAPLPPPPLPPPQLTRQKRQEQGQTEAEAAEAAQDHLLHLRLRGQVRAVPQLLARKGRVRTVCAGRGEVAAVLCAHTGTYIGMYHRCLRMDENRSPVEMLCQGGMRPPSRAWLLTAGN